MRMLPAFRWILLSTFIGLGPLLGYAQSFSLKGRVLSTESKVPIEQAAITIFSLDSVCLATAISASDGAFSCNLKEPHERVLVRITHLSYASFMDGWHCSADERCFNLQPAERNLKEVTVKGSKPYLKAIAGGISYKMQEFLPQTSVNALDALSSIPGITKTGDLLSLLGSTSLTIAINGQVPPIPQAQLYQVLRGMPSHKIDQVELLYTAPPQYRVRGSVLNVILTQTSAKDKDTEGIKGEVHSTLGKFHQWRGDIGGSLDYKKKRTSLLMIYDGSYRPTQEIHELEATHVQTPSPLTVNQSNLMTRKELGHMGYIDWTQQVGKGTLQATYNLLYHPHKTHHSLSQRNRQEHVTDKSETDHLHALQLNFSQGSLTVGANFMTYRLQGTQDFNWGVGTEASPSSSRYMQRLNRYKIYADHSMKLAQDWKLNYGGSFTYTQSNDAQDVISSTTYPKIEGRGEEYLSSLYLGVEKRFNNGLSIATAVTAEYQKFSLEEYWALLPQLQATYMKSPKHIFQLSLASERKYPAYWEHRAYLTPIDGYMLQEGNPSLRSYRQYDLRFNYIYKQKYVFALYNTYQPDYFAQQIYVTPDAALLRLQTQNWDYQHILGVLSVVPITFGKRCNTQLTANVFLTQSKHSKFYDVAFRRRNLTGYLAARSSWQITRTPSLVTDLSVSYLFHPVQGLYNLSNPFTIDWGVKWQINAAASLTLKATDLLHLQTPNVCVDYHTQQLHLDNESDTRGISLHFQYHFGGFKARKKQAIDTSRFGH